MKDLIKMVMDMEDIPYKHYVYADKLWLYNPNVKFFYGSVIMDLLNFLAKFIPFQNQNFQQLIINQ